MSPADWSPPSAPRARVAASTSNLGPGFDCLGLALSLFLEVELLGPAPSGRHELERAEGEAGAWPRESNLFFRAFDAARASLGLPPLAMRFAARSEIPIARGLGSSGAAIAAGLLLARAHSAGELADEELCRIGAELEGHPDNSTASLLGGCTLAVPTPGGLAVVRQELAPELRFAVAWPRTTVPTSRARAVLPASVAFADAVENPRRLALLLEGLRRAEPELLRLGSEDRLHVRHRLPLVPGGERALRAAEEAGAWLATVSGSGSALLAISGEERIAAVAEALADGLRVDGPAGEGVQARVLRAATAPPVVSCGRTAG